MQKSDKIVGHKIFSFDGDIAEEYGIDCAIMLQHFSYWIEKNMANRKNFHDGRTWTYNSMAAFTSIFPFFSKSQVQRILVKLEKNGLILKGNYNEMKYNRTNWYALTDYAMSMLQMRNIHDAKSINGKNEIESSIPVIEPVIEPVIKKRENQRFVPPTLAEINSYISENNLTYVNANVFFNYYESNGWKVGKNKMKNWRSAISGWNSREKNNTKKSNNYAKDTIDNFSAVSENDTEEKNSQFKLHF